MTKRKGIVRDEQLTDKQWAFVLAYAETMNKTEAAARAGYKGDRNTLGVVGFENLSKPKIKAAIDKLLQARLMSADEVLTRLAEQAAADVGQFFKVVEEWTFYPLPMHDILDAVEVEEEIEGSDPPKTRTRISYFIRRVAIDTDKLVDPRYSHLLHKVSDSPKGGIEIELYNKQTALGMLGKHYGLFVDRIKQEDWRSEAIEAIRRGEISYEALKDEFDQDLATELFRAAGVPVRPAIQVGEGQGQDEG